MSAWPNVPGTKEKGRVAPAFQSSRAGSAAAGTGQELGLDRARGAGAADPLVDGLAQVRRDGGLGGVRRVRGQVDRVVVDVRVIEAGGHDGDDAIGAGVHALDVFGRLAGSL